MMKRTLARKTASLTMAALITLAGASTAFAAGLLADDSRTRPLPPPVEAPATPRSFEVKGTVEYQELEGGFYTVDGHGILGIDEQVLAGLVGRG